MVKLLWHLLIIKYRIPGLIWRQTAHFVQNKTTIILHGNYRRTTIFGAKLEAWRQKMFHIFHFLQCDMVLGIVNPLSWIFNAISNEKSCLISMLFLSTYIDVRTVKFFPPAESWLVNSNFPRKSRMQGHHLSARKYIDLVRRKYILITYYWLLTYCLLTDYLLLLSFLINHSGHRVTF